MILYSQIFSKNTHYGSLRNSYVQYEHHSGGNRPALFHICIQRNDIDKFHSTASCRLVNNCELNCVNERECLFMGSIALLFFMSTCEGPLIQLGHLVIIMQFMILMLKRPLFQFRLHSPRPLWPRGFDRRDHLCSQLPGLHPAAVGQDAVQKHPHDAGTGGSQPHQGEHTMKDRVGMVQVLHSSCKGVLCGFIYIENSCC